MSSPTSDTLLTSKLTRVRELLREMQSVVVCFSGGIDSALLLALANEELGDNALGMTAISPSLPPGEREESAAVAKAIGARHEFISSNEIEDPNYQANNPDRCFHCKTELYTLTTAEARRRGIAQVISGIIADDLGDYRPGIDAARENGVRFPLAEAGFTKADVRAAAAQISLTIWNKPASACLSSRIPYGTSVTRERLGRVGGLEAELKAMRFRQVRVRYHEFEGTTPFVLARIELELSELPRTMEPGVREQIVEAGRRHGFNAVTVDLAGYRMGSQNDVLKGRQLKILSLFAHGVAAASKACLHARVGLAMRGGCRATAIAASEPPAALEHCALATLVVAHDPLIDVADHVSYPKGAGAAGIFTCGRAQITQALSAVEDFFSIVVAAPSVARVAIGIRQRVFALTGKGPLGLTTETLAFGCAERGGFGEGHIASRTLLSRMFELVAIDTESLPLTQSGARAR